MLVLTREENQKKTSRGKGVNQQQTQTTYSVSSGIY